MDQIILKNMAFYGHHGNLSEENKLGQRFFIDLLLDLNLKEAGEQDNVSYTVNYAEAYEIVKAVVEGECHRLIEAVGECIASRIKESFPMIEAVEVRVRKPEAPIPGVLDYAEVVIRR